MSFHIALDDHVVPYLCEGYTECGANDFNNYPARYHFDVDKFTARGNTHTTRGLELLATFLQRWLVFGLMRTILGSSGISIDLDDFVFPVEPNQDNDEDSEPQSLVADTTNLSLYTLYWIAKETHIHDSERTRRTWLHHAATFAKVGSVVNKLIIWRREFYPLGDHETYEPHTLDSVILSTVLLSEYLIYSCKKIFGSEAWDMEWELDNLLRWRLLRAGWCSGEVVLPDCHASMPFEDWGCSDLLSRSPCYNSK